MVNVLWREAYFAPLKRLNKQSQSSVVCPKTKDLSSSQALKSETMQVEEGHRWRRLAVRDNARFPRTVEPSEYRAHKVYCEGKMELWRICCSCRSRWSKEQNDDEMMIYIYMHTIHPRQWYHDSM